MNNFRDRYKKLTGENCKTVARYDVENKSDIYVKMFSPRYVDWLERKLENELKTSESNCNIPLVSKLKGTVCDPPFDVDLEECKDHESCLTCPRHKVN